MIHPSKMRATDHLAVAQEMLGRMGDADSVDREVSHAQRNKALAAGAEAHIAMAKFKLDYPEISHKSRTETEAAIEEELQKG